MTPELKGTVAAITGGADGIGLALAKALAVHGVTVVLLDIREDAAHAAAEQLSKDGHSALAMGCDVSDAASLEAAARRIGSEFGALNHLWVNAGVGVAGDLTDVKQSSLDWVYAVNVEGAIATVRALLPLVEAAAGFRHVGFTASSNTLGRIPAGPFGVYAASKWALLGVAESIAGWADARGIGSTILCPGLLDTRIWDGARARPDRFGGIKHQPEEAGAVWRETGMSADWAATEAIAAALAGRAYCAPVDQHSVDDFEARVAAVREGFVVHHAAKVES